MIIGVTGPSGAGKSVVCGYLAQAFGFKVIDCDEYARKAVCDQMLKELTDCFGKEILNSDQTLNRPALAAVAFATGENTKRLNSITHPYIIKMVLQDAKQYENVILDAPTLFESGLNKECDEIIAVLAQKGVRTERILSRDGLSEEQLALRHKAAKPDEFYTAKTDKIIINDGNLSALQESAKQMLCKIIGGNK